MSTDRRSRHPLDTALDLMLFAPIGLLTNCRHVVPELAAKGREVVDQQVSMARFVGRFVVRQGRQQAPSTAAKVLSHDEAEATDQHTPVRLEEASGNGDERASVAAVATADEPGVADVDELAIPQYDSLAASQVVARLEGLTAAELDAVRRYEVVHRGRKTVLGKIDQLQRQ